MQINCGGSTVPTVVLAPDWERVETATNDVELNLHWSTDVETIAKQEPPTLFSSAADQRCTSVLNLLSNGLFPPSVDRPQR